MTGRVCSFVERVQAPDEKGVIIAKTAWLGIDFIRDPSSKDEEMRSNDVAVEG
jgi:hypothetical protein